MNPEPPNPRLNLPREEMRALGYRVIDMLVDHFDTVRDKPVGHAHHGARPGLEARLRQPPPEHPAPPGAVLEQLQRDVFSHISHVDHPRFFAFIPSPSNYVSALADALAAGFNVFQGTWIESSGPSTVEMVVMDWLRALCGMPETAGGLCVSGGSMANLTGLAVARHIKLRDRVEGAVLYYSDQTHSSIERGLRVLGFAPEQIRKLPADEAFRLDVATLRRAVAEDRAAGRVPFCVIANAATTNTGAVDPMAALAAFCRDEGLWLHADGAYGAAAVLCDEGRAALRGLEHVDSLSLDPHKWLFQPYEVGCVLVRQRRWLKETFHILPEYLQDTQGPDEEINFADYGVQLTRYFRALKLWMSFKIFGLAAFREAVAHGFRLAEAAEEIVRAMPDWEIVTPAQMAILAFRYAPPGHPPAALDTLNLDLVAAMLDDGFAMLSTSVLRGRVIIRLCPINPRTTEADLRETLTKLDGFGRAIIA